MKLQILSDVHFEMHRDHGRSFLESIQPNADVLVLAGDIIQTQMEYELAYVIAYVHSRWKHVIYVAGNHEAYRNDLQLSTKILKYACEKHGNVHLLNNNHKTIDGVKFFGGTGWFPDPAGDPIAVASKSLMNDFVMIRDLEPAIYKLHRQFEQESLRGSPDVVVSHHLPDPRCVAPQYAGSPVNRFFVSDFDVEAVGAKSWIHGHTHTPTDFTIGDTRIISNPLGYPREPNDRFNESLVVEV